MIIEYAGELGLHYLPIDSMRLLGMRAVVRLPLADGAPFRTCEHHVLEAAGRLSANAPLLTWNYAVCWHTGVVCVGPIREVYVP